MCRFKSDLRYHSTVADREDEARSSAGFSFWLELGVGARRVHSLQWGGFEKGSSRLSIIGIRLSAQRRSKTSDGGVRRDGRADVTRAALAASCREALVLGAPSLLRCVIDPELSEYERANAVATLLNIESAEIDQLLTRARV